MRTDTARRNEHGFSLVEVMVSLLVIGILVAIGLPMYIGAVRRAEDTAAKASLRTAQAAARIVFTRDQSFSAATIPALQDADPTIGWHEATDPSTDVIEVSRAVVGRTLVLAAYAPNGTCFFLRDDPDARVGLAKLVDVPSADCTAANAGAATFGVVW